MNESERCATCRAPRDPGDGFCRGCGRPLRPAPSRPARSGKSLLVALLLMALLVGVPAAALLYAARRESAAASRRTAAAEATVIEVRGYGATHKTITYSFVAAGGRPVTAKQRRLGRRAVGLKVGQSVTACYDPSDPDDSAVYPAGWECGGDE